MEQCYRQFEQWTFCNQNQSHEMRTVEGKVSLASQQKFNSIHCALIDSLIIIIHVKC